MAKNEVQVKETGALARPSFLKDTKRGSEQVTREDLIIPRLEIVQSLSPARKKDNPEYIEGAEEGMLYNSVTRELYGDEVVVVPVYYAKEWLVWKDRKKGGGFRGAFPSKAEADAAIAALPADDNKDEFEAMDTAQHYCLLLKADGRVQQIALSMSRSKMKVSRKWNSLIAMDEDDSFAKKYKVTGVADKNNKGEEFYNLTIKPVGYVTEVVYSAAEAMYELIKSGSVKVDHATPQEGEDGVTRRPATVDTEF